MTLILGSQHCNQGLRIRRSHRYIEAYDEFLGMLLDLLHCQLGYDVCHTTPYVRCVWSE